MNIQEHLQTEAGQAEEIITSYLPKDEGPVKPLVDAMRYSVESGGKRLRPVLMNATFTCFGGKDRRAIDPMMAAIEFIHSFSLVHDDLPAMDNDELRRGRPTTHIQYGEARAILAGDSLLNLAAEVVLDALDVSDENTIRAARVLFEKAGWKGMGGGQEIDVAAEKEGRAVDPKTLDLINEKKTGALIEASMMVGAILAGADEEAVDDVERAAGLVGRAFQILDDILDVEGDEEKLGKPIGSDARNQKTTYVDVFGLEGARKEADDLTRQAIAIMESYEGENHFITELFDYLMKRER